MNTQSSWILVLVFIIDLLHANSSGLEGVGGLESTTKGAEAATTEKITSLRVISNHLMGPSAVLGYFGFVCTIHVDVVVVGGSWLLNNNKREGRGNAATIYCTV